MIYEGLQWIARWRCVDLLKKRQSVGKDAVKDSDSGQTGPRAPVDKV